MSSRERWIVYPLLFLTLGIVMRDKIIPQAHFQSFQSQEIAAERIRCGQLQVDQVAIAARIVGRSIQCGEFSVAGPNGRPTVIILTDPKNKGGAIETLSLSGAPLVRLQPTESGGVVIASEFLQGNTTPPEKPKAAPTPLPKQPSKEPGKAPAKANK